MKPTKTYGVNTESSELCSYKNKAFYGKKHNGYVYACFSDDDLEVIKKMTDSKICRHGKYKIPNDSREYNYSFYDKEGVIK